MDLQTLKFKVETGELVSAVTAIKNLGTEVSKLNKPVSDAALNAEKLAQAQAKTTAANARAEIATIKLGKAQEDSNKPIKESVSVLQRQQDILAFMTEGYSKGQSSVLAYAKASGALNDELNQIGTTLKTQRTLMGTDPFDKSIGTLEAWTNKLKVASEVQSLYNRNLGLTKGQMEELARDKLRLNELFKDKGVGASVAEYEKLVKVASQTAVTINAVTDSVKNQEKWINETAKANAYLEKEMHRLDTALQETNKDLGSGSVNALIRFETALKKSGMTIQEQITQLDLFKKKLAETNKQSGNRQVDYLSRALGPQITDIAVGLATGQAPLTVMLQQGGQLRDQFALAGVAGADMGKMLVEASKAMVGSVKDVSLAVGQLVGTAFMSSGKAVMEFGGRITGVTSLMEKARYQLTLMSMASGDNGLISAFNGASKALQVFTGGLVVGAAALGVAFLVGLKEVIKQEGELTKALALSGGALGISRDRATELAKTFAGSKGNIGDFTEAITAAAKAGNITSNNLEAVTTAAVALNKAAGVDVAQTVKEFSKLGEKPVESIRELAKTTGLLSPQVLQAVDLLEKQGNRSEAAALATRAYSDALKKAAAEIKTDMGVIETIFKGIGSTASDMWDKILNVGRRGALADRLKEASADVAQRMREGASWYQTGAAYQEELVRLKEIEDSLRNQVALEKAGGDEKAKNSAYADWEIKYGKYSDKALNNQEKFTQQVRIQDQYLKDGIITQEKYNRTVAGLKREIFGEGAQPNNLELAQKAYGEELKMAQTMNDNKRKILKFYYDIGLKDRAEYVSEDTKLLEGSEAEQLAVIEKYQAQFAAAYAVQRAALTSKAGAGSQDVKNLKDKFDELNKTLEITKKTLGDTIDTRSMENMKAIGEVVKQAKDAYVEFTKTVATSQNQRELATASERELAGTYGASAERIKAYREEYNKLIPAITAAQERVNQAEKNLAGSPADTEQRLLAERTVAETKAYLAKTTAEAQIAAGKAASDAEIKYNDMSIKRLNAYNDAFANAFQGMADALVTFAQTGKLSFKGLIDSMLTDLIRFELRAQMSALYSATGGASGLMSMLGLGGGMTAQTSALTGGTGNASGISTQAALGKAYDGGVQMFAKGGSFTNSIVDSPTLFKFAKGTGLMGEAGPEAIMPLRRGPDGSLGVQSQGGGGGNVSVNVINNSSAQATTSETKDSRGNRQIEVIIGDMAASEVQRSGSASQKAMKNTFGVQPQLIRR
jgi:lambda family phage tail tape measure protein